MIFSNNLNVKESEDDNSSAEGGQKEGVEELEHIINIKQKNDFNKDEKDQNDFSKCDAWPINNNPFTLGDSNNLSKIEAKNENNNTSKLSFSRGEDFIQKDILQVLDGQINKKAQGGLKDSVKKVNVDNKIIEMPNENSFQSKGKHNFVLKADFLNNTGDNLKDSFLFEQQTNNPSNRYFNKVPDESVKQNEIEQSDSKLYFDNSQINGSKLFSYPIPSNSFNNNENNSISNYFNGNYNQNNNIFTLTNQINNLALVSDEQSSNEQYINNFQNNYQNNDNIFERQSKTNINNNIISQLEGRHLPDKNVGCNYYMANEQNNSNQMNNNHKIANSPMIGAQEKINQNSLKDLRRMDIINSLPVGNFSDIQNQEGMNNNILFSKNSNINTQIQNFYGGGSGNNSSSISNQFINSQPGINMNNPNIEMNIRINNIINKKSEKDLLENCVSYCKEQIECRALQKKIDENQSLASEFIYPKIKEKIVEISMDQFGNYFAQKVIENLKIEQIKEILYKKVAPQYKFLSMNQYGTRVVQKIFEKILNYDDLLNYYTQLLTPNLKDFIVDQNASHIIIKYVNMVPAPKNNFIIQFLIDNAFDLAIKKHSCCVLQKCIEYSNPQQKKSLLNSIATKSYGLFCDQFGNYVVQYCITPNNYEINRIIVNNFLFDIPKFSTQKYSSNVIEKCLDCCDEETKDLIVEKFCEPSLIQKLLFDMYGNYVLQKIMALAKEPIRTKFFQIVGPLMQNLNMYQFGQKLFNKLLSSFSELNAFIYNNPNMVMNRENFISSNKRIKNKKDKKLKNGSIPQINFNNGQMQKVGQMNNNIMVMNPINKNNNMVVGQINNYNSNNNIPIVINNMKMMNSQINQNNNMYFQQQHQQQPTLNNYYNPYQSNQRNMNSNISNNYIGNIPMNNNIHMNQNSQMNY